jgi:hypothetical protein
MSDLQSLFLYSNKGLVKSSGVFPKYSNNKPEILNNIRTFQLKNSKDKVRILRVRTKKAANKEYQNTNTYISFHKDKIVKAYIKKLRSSKWVVIKAALSSLNKRLKRESEFRQLSDLNLKTLIWKQTIKSTSVNKGSKVYKTSAQSSETIKNSPGPKARASKVGAGKEVKA